MKTPPKKNLRKRRSTPLPRNKPLHFLIVEDEPAHAELIRRGLLSYDKPYRLTVTTTLAGARDLIAADPPALIILDWLLPDGKGEDLLPENPEDLRFPVIFMTGYGDEALATRILESGAVDYFVKGKPFFDDLPHIAERALRTWRDRQLQQIFKQKLITQGSVLQTLLNNPADSIVLLDREGVILDLNTTLADRLGKSASSLIGTCMYDHLPKNIARSRRQCIDEVFKTGKVIRSDDERDGRWYDNIALPVKDGTGEVSQVVVIARDITERKQAERRLTESEARLDLALCSAEMGIWQWDIIKNRRTFDDLTCHLLGINPTTFTGSAEEFYAVVHPDDREVLKEALARTIERDVRYNPVYRAVWSDGSVHHITARGKLVKDTEGKPVRINGLIWDISERKRMEDALRESEERYRSLIDELPDYVIVHQKGELLFVNNSISMVMGSSVKDLLHSNILTYVAPESREIVLKAIEKREHGGSMPPYAIRLLIPDGSTRWVEVRGAPIQFEGQPANLNVLTDITERKWAEEELFKSEEKFRTVANYTFDWEYWTGPTGEFIYTSPSCERITGYSPDDFYHNKNLMVQIVVPEDQELFREHFNHLTGDQDSQILEFRISTKEGATVWIGHICRPIYSTEEKYLGRRGSNRDITERKRAEDALRESEIRFRSLIQNASDMIRIIDRDRKIVYESHSSERILGYPPGFLIGKDPMEYIHPDDLELVKTDFEEVIDRENPGIPTEFRIRKADGTYIWVDSLGVNMIDVPGIDGVVITTRPIGQRKEMEQALLESQAKIRESEEYLRRIISGAHEGIISYDRELRITLWNRFMEELTGLPAGKVLGKKAVEIFKFHKENGVDLLLETALNGIASESHDFPFMITSTGRSGWAKGIYSPNYSADGNIVGAIGIVRDITERKRAEDALRESETRFRQVAESSRNWIWEIDAYGLYTYSSPVVKEILGYSPDEIVGKMHFYDLFVPEEREKMKTACLLAFGQKQPFYAFINENLHKNGTRVFLETSGEPILDKTGKLTGYRGADTDITEKRKAEEALRKSEERYRTVVEDQTEVICRFRNDGTHVFVNEAYCRYFGLKREDIIGKKFTPKIPAEDQNAITKHFACLTKTHPVGGITHRIIMPDGEVRWQNWSDRAIFDPDGTIIEYQSVGRDISEIVRAQEALAESESKFKSLIEYVFEPILILDFQGNIRFANKAAADLIEFDGYAGIIGRNVMEFIAPESQEEVIRDFVEISNGHDAYFANYNVISTKGKKICVESIGKVISYEGKPADLLSVRDITERSLIEKALRESEERYRDLFNLSPVCIVLTNQAGNILGMNDAMHTLFGYTDEEIPPMNISEFYADPDQRRQVAELLRSNGAIRDKELVFRRHDGYTFPAILNSSSILRNGEMLFQSSLFDITDRKMMEEEIRSLNRSLEQRVTQRTMELNASLQEKEILLREIHHRVKNNLQIIISILRLQKRHIEDSRVKEVLLDSESRVRSMALVHEKLYRSADLAHIDIGDYLKTLANYLFTTYSVNPKQVTFRVRITNLELDINRAIPVGLILNELISNSLKHAFPGERAGTILMAGEQEGDDIVLSLKDDGIGMLVGFDWKHSTSLGMHLVMTLIEQVQGKIDISGNGKGTHFIIRIPRDPGKVSK